MAEITTKGQLLNTIELMAVEYARSGINASLHRNRHLNGIEEHEMFDETSCCRILVDFINNAGLFQGLDWGLTIESFKNQINMKDGPIKVVMQPKTKPDSVIDLNL